MYMQLEVCLAYKVKYATAKRHLNYLINIDLLWQIF